MNSCWCRKWPQLNYTFNPMVVGYFGSCDVHIPLLRNNMSLPLHTCCKYLFSACLIQPGWGVLRVIKKWVLWMWHATCPSARGWRGGRGSSRRFIPSIDSGKNRGQSSHSCCHWMFFSARSLCQIPVHVVACEMRSASMVWSLHVSSKQHTLYMGAFPLNWSLGAIVMFGLGWLSRMWSLFPKISPSTVNVF